LLVDWDEKVISFAERKVLSITDEQRPEVISCVSNFARLDEIMEQIKNEKKK